MQVFAAPAARRHQRGLTLIEMMSVVAVVGVLAGTAAPAFDKVQKRRSLDGAALQMLTDFHFARSEAVARNSAVRLSFLSAADGAQCVVVHTGPADDCACGAAGAAQCNAPATVLKVQSVPAGHGLSITANVASMLIDPVRGTVSPAGTIRVTQAGGTEIRHVVSMMGRVRSCAASGSVYGYKAC
jgi:type IV fimbrial biogenesis protein FimT